MELEVEKKLFRLAAFVGAVTVIAGGYSWYLNNIWKPNVDVLSVDFEKGIAKVKFGKETINVEGDAIYWLNGQWGIKFGNIRKEDGTTVYDRLELLKNGMVYKYLLNE